MLFKNIYLKLELKPFLLEINVFLIVKKKLSTYPLSTHIMKIAF